MISGDPSVEIKHSMEGVKVLVISLSNLDRDPRVERQLRYFLNRGASLTTMGYSPSNFDSITHLPVEPIKRMRLYMGMRVIGRYLRQLDRLYWNEPLVADALKALEGTQYDLIISNDIETLPVALEVSKGASVMFDAHEYATRESEEQWRWRLVHQPMRMHLCRKYLSKADILTTVCQTIADEYQKNYQVKMAVVTNAPAQRLLRPTPVARDKVRMIYQGGAAPGRRIEQVFEIMDGVDERFKLDMILVPGDQAYIDSLVPRIESHPKIQLVPPVPMLEIPAFCNQYDVGFYPLQPTNFNNLHALPNKFFEFIQARVPPVITPQPNMATLVKKYQCGVVAKDFSSAALIDCLNALSYDDIVRMKSNCNLAAAELNAEQNEKVWDQLFSPILPSLCSAN